jgi:23S rRNA (uridine2552-2'-O)-methyltransferase
MSKPYERKDHLYKKAKSKGLRSRANFKLQELNEKYKLLREGQRVLDLGAWPGGWLQYILSCIGRNGKAVGIDLQDIEDLNDNRVKTINGDASDQNVIEEALNFSGGNFDVVISDMSAKLTGIKESDQARASALTELACSIAEKTLVNGGNFVCKTFKGHETDLLFKKIKPKFSQLLRSELDASRKSSNEYYLVGLGIIS